MLLETTPPAAETDPRGRPWITFSALVAMAALTILDVSKVGVALPAIQQSTGRSESAIQFMLVGYTIAYALLLLPSGRLGDVIDRKRVFLFGACIFVGASVLCALSPSASWLVVGRLVQGAGAGVLMPQVLGIIQRIFPAGRRTKPLAILAAILAATSTFGPVIAGTVMQLVGTPDSWRALFWINVGVGAIVVPLAWRFIREPYSEKRRGFDLAGVALLTPAVVLTIFPLSTISSTSAPAPWMLAATAVGLCFGVLFVRHEMKLARGTTQPLVDPLLFAIRHFPSGLVISGLAYAAGTASALVVTLSLQQAAGQSALQTALWMLPAAAAAVTGSWITSRLPQATSYRLIAVGTGIGAVALLSISLALGSVPQKWLPLALCLLLVVNSFGSSLVGAPNQARTLLEVPDFRSSIAGSLIQFSQRIGSAIGLALALIIYYVFEFNPVPWTGRPTLGPTLAIALTAAFTATSLIVALADRDRRAPALR
ncbi:MAG: transporter [Microbacteriaceae bacterium]|nr:transporter [Microbacteriaceae bacterium]